MAAARQILFVQGAGAGVHDDWDARLVDSLRNGLAEGYEIRYPRMPHEEDPDYGSWRAAIDRELLAVEDGAVAVGHSVGATILIDVLAGASHSSRLAAIVLIAAPFVGGDGWPAADFALPENLGALLPQGVPVHLFHGSDDNIVSPDHVDLYSRAIPSAHVHRLSGRDHQLNEDLREVAEVIRIALRKSGD